MANTRPLIVLFSAASLCVVLIVLIVLLGMTKTAMMLSRSQWEDFFPSWSTFLNHRLETDICADDIYNYREFGREKHNYGYDVINCILEAMPESRKSELASSTVILGLAPAFLAMLAPPYADTAILAFHCPSLALLLASGSPAIHPFTPQAYARSIHDISTRLDTYEERTGQREWGPRKSFGRLWAEHLLALAAIANTVHLTYGLGVYAVVNFAPSRTTFPGIYLMCAIILHLFSVFISWPQLSGRTKRCRLSASKSETALGKLTKELGGGTQLFASFLVLVSTLCMLFGTVLLSSIVFLSAWDSITVVVRYYVSAAACRIILFYEISSVKQWLEQRESAAAGTRQQR